MGEWNVVDRAETEEAVIEVIEYPSLKGSSDASSAEQIFFVQQAGRYRAP